MVRGHRRTPDQGWYRVSSSDREVAGQRIARARRRRGLSQAVLAGLVGRSESWLSQVERGKRGIDSHSVLVRLAEVLRVDVEELTGSGDGDEPSRRVHPAASLIEQAMMAYGAAGASTEHEEADRQLSLDYLRAKARSAYQAYQATRYDTTGRILPGLIRGVETAAHSVGAARPDACGVRVLVYDTTAALLSRVGEPFLAWAAADRARSAAGYVGDPLLAAVCAWRLSYMITGRKHPQEALGLAMTAAAALERAMRAPSPEQLSVYGALHLAAATAAAACYDRATTETVLAKARGIADRTGEANHMGTAFGPVNVAIHAISASLRLGDPRTATETGEALDTAAMPVGLVGRRTQVNLDLARAYAMCRKDAAAVNLLLAAERLSPQLVRYDQATRDVLTELLRREHRPSTPELRPLAHRAGVI
jgi:transcriptional regulator with XRE-family HTH domain